MTGTTACRFVPWMVAMVLALLILPARVTAGDLATVDAKAKMENARTIALLLFQYANDNDGAYPTGKSSTEVFQKLIDGKYCTDPSIFYFQMAGKTKPTSTTLKPENVCWDVTTPVQSGDPDGVPLIFSTGYKVSYTAGGSAVPLKAADITILGVTVTSKSMSTIFLKDDGQPDHEVKNFLPASFNPGGKTYQQLGPDGAVGP